MDNDERKRILNVFDLLIRTKKTEVDLFTACRDAWKEDEVFWEPLVEEKKYHVQEIERMKKIVAEQTAEFELGNPFRFDIAETFIADVEAVAKKVKNGEMTKKDGIVAARNFEQSVINTKYSEIVSTNNTEYLEIAREVVSQSVLHKGKLSKRATDLDKGVWSVKPDTALPKKISPAADAGGGLKHDFTDAEKGIQAHHNQLKEYIGFLRQLEGGLQKHSVWMHLEKIEKFMKKDVIDHFRYEEEVVFHDVLLRQPAAEIKNLIAELHQEHNALTEKINEFEGLIYGELFPLPKEKVSKINAVLESFSSGSIEHMAKEEQKILPLL